MKPGIFASLRVAVSAVLILLLVWMMRDSLGRVAEELKRVDIPLFILAFCIFSFVSLTIGSFRMKMIFEEEQFKFSLSSVIQLTYIGYFFNNFMPTAVGGDIVKAYYASRRTNEKARSFGCVFMDRFIGLFAFIILGAAALALNWKGTDIAVKRMVLVTLAISICAILAVINVRVAGALGAMFSRFKLMDIGEKLARFYSIIHNYRNKAPLLRKSMLLSFFSQSAYFATIYVLSRSLGLDLDFRIFFLIMPIVSVISILPSIGGLGLREGAMVALFGPIVGNADAFSLSLLLLAVLIITSFIGGVIYLVSPQFKFVLKEGETA